MIPKVGMETYFFDFIGVTHINIAAPKLRRHRHKGSLKA